MKHRAFTLVEVVVTVAIVIVLAAISVTVYSVSIKRGHEADCTSQLRQLAQAHEMYSQAAGDDGLAPLMNDWRPILPYLGDRRLLHCKSDPYRYGANSSAWEATGTIVSYYGIPYIEERLVSALKTADPNHGIFVCFTHGKGNRLLIEAGGPAEPLSQYSGLTLRARKDTSVQRAFPRVRCFEQEGGMIIRWRSWWDVFTDDPNVPKDVLDSLTGNMKEVPCK